ncbi:MAG: phosphoglucomutase/phosphomannomutase family protein [Chloroflexi bacterium]|nr:phosphoglucomutase/phosphomannomutase family protein [Chloroflexota bacterium]
MGTKILFGTDGWRGVIADDYTFENVRRCAQGFASYLLSLGNAGAWVVVGHDKRFASEHFAAACAEVLAGNGLHVWLTDGATPTPVIAYAVLDKQAAGAINITASHNPPADNGFKVRDHRGGAIDPDGLKRIEALIPDDTSAVKRVAYADAEAQGLARKFDASVAYITHLKDLIDLEPIKQAGLKIVVDAMWGNGAGWFPRLIGGGRTQIIEIHNTRNPSFPEMKRPEPIQPNVDVGLATTKANNADVCIITDGDADRLGVGDEHGAFINQLRVYGLLALYLLEARGQRGAIVKTLSTTSMLDKLGALYGVPVHTTGVGFKYVAPKMLETDALIGGEESGGYAFRGHCPERDGILAGLYILDMMVRLRKKPSELIELLFAKVGAHYYDRVDTTFPAEQREAIQARILGAKPAEIGGLAVTGLDTTDGYKFFMDGGDWLLVRFSGTEPIMRFYTETTRADKVQPILQAGLRLAGF